jgi:hypothetical protein
VLTISATTTGTTAAPDTSPGSPTPEIAPAIVQIKIGDPGDWVQCGELLFRRISQEEPPLRFPSSPVWRTTSFRQG